MSTYKNLLIDLDDTLWDCSQNAEDTFREVYQLFGLKRFFQSFEQFYTIYHKRNVELWADYGKGLIGKDELNEQRFAHPFRTVDAFDPDLVHDFREAFFARIPCKSKVKPHTHEALEYLATRYRLHILSNGFRELQERKMKSAGIFDYFDHIVLSDDIGVHKPSPLLFDHAIRQIGATREETLMIGDNWEVDIEGAKASGIDQLFYNPKRQAGLPFRPTLEITDWAQVASVL